MQNIFLKRLKDAKITHILFFVVIFIFFIVKITKAIPLEHAIPGPDGDISSVEGLSDYIRIVYSYGIYAGSVLAVVMISVNAFKWVSAGGNKGSIDKAKNGMIMSIVGLFLVFGSYLILSTINGELVALKALNVYPISPQEFVGVDFSTMKLAETLQQDIANDIRCNLIADNNCPPGKVCRKLKDKYICTEPLGDNMACEIQSECRPPLTCNAQTLKCEIPPVLQCAGILDNYRCFTNLYPSPSFGYCDNRQCVPCRGEGQICTTITRIVPLVTFVAWPMQCVNNNSGICGLPFYEAIEPWDQLPDSYKAPNTGSCTGGSWFQHQVGNYYCE